MMHEHRTIPQRLAQHDQDIAKLQEQVAELQEALAQATPQKASKPT